MPMNLKNKATDIQLRQMIRMADDKAASHMVWVGNDGEVHIDPIPVNLTPLGYAEQHKSEMKFRYETFARGNGYVGEKAAKDKAYVAKLFSDLSNDWASAKTGYIDY